MPKITIKGRSNGENTATLNQLVGGSQGYRVYGTDGLSVTLASNGGGAGAKTGLYLVGYNRKDGITGKRDVAVKPCLTPDRINKRQNGRRFKENGEPMFTLTSQDRHGVEFESVKGIAIRKLTPKECFRLQGWADEYFYKAQQFNSDSQLYKQAGNGVTVNVISEIAKRL